VPARRTKGRASSGDEPILMEVRGLMLDPSSNNPIVVLRDPASQTFLPIWIGLFEASAIQLGLESAEAARPRTHDLLNSCFEALGGRVVKVVVEDLRDQTFYAVIHVEQGDKLLHIDARPSDAIALALRADAPVFVQPTVLEQAQAHDASSEEERVRKLLEDLDPEDLGEYKM
jgi:bifunctional DNase/RNase